METSWFTSPADLELANATDMEIRRSGAAIFDPVSGVVVHDASGTVPDENWNRAMERLLALAPKLRLYGRQRQAAARFTGPHESL